MRISDWSSDVCSSDLPGSLCLSQSQRRVEVSPKLGFDRTQRDITAITACIASIMRTGAAQHVGTSAHGKAVGRHAAEHRHERRRAVHDCGIDDLSPRSEEHTSELQSLMRISYAVFCLKKKKQNKTQHHNTTHIHVYN